MMGDVTDPLNDVFFGPGVSDSSVPPLMLSHNATGTSSEQGMSLLISWQFIIQWQITHHLLLWQRSAASVFWPVHDHFQDPWVTGVSHSGPLCDHCDPLTPCSISGMRCRGEPPFEHPAQQWQSRCQEELCFSANHF